MGSSPFVGPSWPSCMAPLTCRRRQPTCFFFRSPRSRLAGPPRAGARAAPRPRIGRYWGLLTRRVGAKRNLPGGAMQTIDSVAELEALYGVPRETATIKEVAHVTPEYAQFIAASPFVSF